VTFPTVAFVLPALVCALSWLGAGSLVPARWVPRNAPLLAAVAVVGCGSVVFSVLLLVLGRVHAFRPTVVIAVTVAFALVGLPRALALARRRPRAPGIDGRLTRILLGLVVLALVVDVVAATAPPTSADALRYHLALPERWLDLGRMDDSFWDWDGILPFGVEMLFAQGLALGGGETAGAIGALLGVLAALAVYGLGRELAEGSATAGVAAAALFVLQGIVTWEATSSFVELGLTFYLTLAVWFAVRYWRDRAGIDAGWTGFFVGAAAGTKYHALVLGTLVILGVAALAGRSRVRHVALALALAVLAGGAWYAKNAIVTGNPAYPAVFGGKWWTEESQVELESIGQTYGLDAPVVRLALLPVDLLRHGDRFDRGQAVGIAIFLLAPLALLVWRRTPAAVLLAGCLVYLVFWWETTQQARFLLPVLAVLSALGGAATERLLRAGGLRRAAVAAVLAVTALAWLVTSAALTRQLLPVTVGLESREDFLERLTGTYRAFRQVDGRVDGTLALAGYNFPFNYPGAAVVLRTPGFAPDVGRDTYLARLRSLGVERILAGGDPARIAELDPIRSCLRRRATYQARYVLSRSREESEPLMLTLFSADGC
jgi:hypothetical protein